MRRFRLPILVLGLCLGLGGLWAYAADPTGSNTTAPANTTTGTCTGTGCGTNTSGTSTGTCTGANCGTNTNVATLTSTYVGPGDVVSGANGWYSCARAYSKSYVLVATNKLCNIRRASDSHTCDILTSTSGAPGNTGNCSSGADNGQTASAFCNATTCSITEAYDQTGTGAHLTQVTAADQPTLTFNCIGTQSCMTNVANGGLTNASITALSLPWTCSAVYRRNVGGSSPRIFGDFNTGGGNVGTLCFAGAANKFSIYEGTEVEAATATDAVLHAATASLTGAATSTANVDGTDATALNAGANAPTTFRGLMSDGDTTTVNPLTGFVAEAGAWGSLATTSGQRTSLCQNEQAFYGSGNFGAAC